MKKTLVAMWMLGIVLLTGCSMEQKVTINADLSSVTVMDSYTTPAEEKDILKSLGAPDSASYAEMMKESGFTFVGTKTIDGTQYNQYTVTSNNTAQDTKDMFVELTNQKAVMDVSSQSETQSQNVSGTTSMNYSEMGFCNMIITYPFKVAKTNGTLQADGYTVVFDVKQMQIQKVPRAYAISVSGLAESDKITIKGVKNNKAYKKNVEVKVSSEGTISSFKVNGVDQMTNSFYAKKNGKYQIDIETAFGQKKSLTFFVDRKKPTTNIKNKKTYKKTVKITFKDKISGVKKATLNGKKIKSGKKVKKNGNYTLKIYDKAGNVKTVKFTIKK